MSREAEEAAIAFLLRLDPATQQEVLARYEEALQVELDTTPRRLRRVARALHEASRNLGRPPTVREFRTLRREHPEYGWPDPRSITRWLGVRSWNEALARLHLAPVADGDSTEQPVGPGYTWAEAVQAVRDCATDLGRAPTISDYLAWQRRADVRDRPGRRPASSFVFNRIFGGFPEGRVAAGLAEDEPTAANPSDLLLRSASYRVSDPRILDDLRLAATRTSGHLSTAVYDRERRLIYLETKATGRPRALAGISTIQRRFRTWATALDAAGIDATRREPAQTRRGRPQIEDTVLLQALNDAEKANESELTVARYTTWRSGVAIRSGKVLPSPATIFRRFGSWDAALNQMFAWRHEP